MSVRDLIPRSTRRSLAPTSPSGVEHPFFSLRREMNRLFDDMFKGFDIGLPGEPMANMFSGNWPRVEVADDDKAVRVTAELPGMEDKDVELLLEDDILTLRGERRSEQEDAEKQFSERFYGRFERRLRLAYDIKQDEIQASFKNGVLEVVLPKDPASQSRVKRIAVNK